MMKTILLSIVSVSAFTVVSAQENSVYYRQIGTSRLYTAEEYQTAKVVDSIKSAGTNFEFVDSITGTENSDNRKVVVFERLLKSLNANNSVVMKTLNDEKVYSMIDKPLPDFKIKDIKGKTYTTEDIKGKPTLIDFWFHTCGPCKAEMPVLNKIKEKYGDRVNFIALTFDPKELIQPVLDTRPFNFIQLINAKDYVKQIGMHAAPKNIFIDKNGIIRQVYEGVDLTYNKERNKVFLGDGKAITDMLDKLLKE